MTGLPLADVAATEAAGAALGRLLRAGDVVALHGDLGAGKTSLARGALAALGLAEEAPSPSFAIVQAYDRPDVSLPVWHVDLYRLEDAGEAAELGLDEALEDGALLIEWAERLGDRLWPDTLHLTLETTPDGARRLTWAVPAAWEGRWPPSEFSAA
ncbi:tRNA (adenosine(37)-N6)-threonylcarbamoyltransferase complex ATPase subunit type 1 TsaE [Edaphosphingomonas haloaromaticamans]|uniref:tRNA threonylcarbamoyladenosine biosynthesis protein TsaE n=1 Tax=Edaphosphingomonas haloaromaticamans TaxID=653954 RepID=A0A1S1HKR0_9SPHN|nr:MULTISPECIES: tRNA (adenosine(37)-N6)-threonylcarbamoyltransferase complex ATPase subunit type 1 TsaE [Sphingomonas]MDX3885625.1 tRNA (adenosine(37)-N6)-threonylcarbamoyltransferase complex ATPase subunit type 1 TsaE [Sphingomonas sp.]OHT21110.1 tRNA threonylcarbamoyladenosine biosynthesis protein TsaE [Sphingomonas haloaromaticamans]